MWKCSEAQSLHGTLQTEQVQHASETNMLSNKSRSFTSRDRICSPVTRLSTVRRKRTKSALMTLDMCTTVAVLKPSTFCLLL